MINERKPSETEAFICHKASLEKRCKILYQLCTFARDKHDVEIFPCRNYLRDIYIEATGMEEFIDGCGAQKN